MAGFFHSFERFLFFVVYLDGSICLDILQNQWSPIYDISAILTSIRVRSLMKSGSNVQLTLYISYRFPLMLLFLLLVVLVVLLVL